MTESAAKHRNREARQVFVQTLVLNLLVSASKLVCGFWTGSLSMTADGFHSALDASSNILGIAALTISAKPPDDNHPYGHRKFEAFGAVAISFMMFFASWEVLSEAIRRITEVKPHEPEAPLLSYVVMLITVAINFAVARYESKKSVELSNSLLAADSKHTASDIFVSMTVICTLIATQLKLPILDLLGSILIVGIILYAGFSIITAHLGYLMDEAVLDAKEVTGIVMQVPGVKGCHKIRSRGQRDHMFIDLHVQVDKHLSIEEAHKISFAVETAIKAHCEGFADVLVHIEDDNPPYARPHEHTD